MHAVILDSWDYIVNAQTTLVGLLATILKCFDKRFKTNAFPIYHKFANSLLFLFLSILFLKYIDPNCTFPFIEDTFY